MNRRILFLVLLLPFVSFSQSPFGSDLEQGETGKMERPWKLITSGSWAVTFKPKKTKIVVAEFDVSTLNFKGEFTFNLKYEGKRIKLVDVIAFNEEIYCLTSYDNKSKGKRYYLLQKYMGEGRLGKPMVLSESYWTEGAKLTFSSKKYMENIANMNSVKFSVSADQSYLSVLIPKSNLKEENQKDEWVACIFSNSMSQKNIEFILDGKNAKIGEVLLKNNGDLIGISVENVTVANGNFYGGMNNRGKPDYQILGDKYSVFQVSYENEEVSAQTVDLEENKVSAYSLAYLDNKIVFCGFFRDLNGNKYNTFAAGYFYYLFNKNFNIDNYSFVPFDERMEAVMNADDLDGDEEEEVSEKKKKKEERKKEKKKREKLEDLIIQDVFLRQNGEVVILAEQFDFWISERTTTTANGTTTTTVYHYEYSDILAVSFGVTDGETKWMSRIPKRQHSANDGGFYSSYQLIEDNGKLHFLFNDRLFYLKFDELENASRSEKRKALKVRLLGGATISEEGNVTRYIVIDEETYDNIRIAPAFSEYGNGQITTFTSIQEGMFKTRFGLSRLEFLSD
ncbi:MAG: hypothetical protein ACFHU9_06180 [Fluviicola sp.]